jgi:hypothetical protein
MDIMSHFSPVDTDSSMIGHITDEKGHVLDVVREGDFTPIAVALPKTYVQKLESEKDNHRDRAVHHQNALLGQTEKMLGIVRENAQARGLGDETEGLELALHHQANVQKEIIHGTLSRDYDARISNLAGADVENGMPLPDPFATSTPSGIVDELGFVKEQHPTLAHEPQAFSEALEGAKNESALLGKHTHTHLTRASEAPSAKTR